MRNKVNSTNINTEGLKKYAQEKKRLAYEKVDIAIRNINKNKGVINFNAISEVSGVSKTFLYKNAEIRNRIEELRKQQSNVDAFKPSKKTMTESSKDILLSAKNKRIKELETENKHLKEQLMVLRGKYYDSY